jgi:hypothetical protein
MSPDHLPYVDMAKIEAERDALELAIHAIARVRIMDAVSAIHMRGLARATIRRLYLEDRAA